MTEKNWGMAISINSKEMTNLEKFATSRGYNQDVFSDEERKLALMLTKNHQQKIEYLITYFSAMVIDMIAEIIKLDGSEYRKLSFDQAIEKLFSQVRDYSDKFVEAKPVENDLEKEAGEMLKRAFEKIKEATIC